MKHFKHRVILVVEDDEPKLSSIVNFLSEVLMPEMKINTAASLTSAVKTLTMSEVLLAIVDMSLPTYDFAIDRAGGQPQGYGGSDILRFIETETTETLSMVLTQYEEFPTSDGLSKSIKVLESELKTELGERFLGIVHYSGRQGSWREALLKILVKNNWANSK